MGVISKLGSALDSVIGMVSPASGLDRVRSRLAMTLTKRHYDAAESGGRRSSNRRGRGTSAADEVSRGANAAAANVQDLCRNSPLANRIKLIWASNMIGLGIRAQIETTNKNSRKRVNDAWEKWASSLYCDFYGTYDFYGLQWLWACTIVECGGVLVRFHIDKSVPEGYPSDLTPIRLQTIEQTMLDATHNKPDTPGNIIRDGIEFDEYGRPVGYWIKNVDPTTNTVITDKPAIFLAKGVDCIHLYRKERSSQHLGMSWLTQVATTIDKYNILIDAKLMQDQIAACLGVFIEGASNSVGVGEKNSRIEELEPGMVQYVDKDSKVHTITPPSSQGSQQFIEIIRSDIAIGDGLAGTQLTGDYSKLNFASGRMSKIEFFQTLDYCQYQLFEPNLNVIADKFLRIFSASTSGKMSNVKSVTWAYPPRAVVDPKDELDFVIRKTRAGFESPIGACKSFGTDFAQVVDQWKESKKIMGDMPFDIDPAKFSVAGNQLDDNDAAASNSNTAKGDPNVDE